jgi:predicted RNase H-like nuclease (RuvC/YqgF family)
MANVYDMYSAKRKRAVDPNAPPRPNLLSHEKVIKDTRSVIERQGQQITMLLDRVSGLERKLESQTSYLSALHQTLQSKKR